MPCRFPPGRRAAPGAVRWAAQRRSILPKDGENPELAWLFYEFLMFDEAGYTAVYGPNDVYPSGLNTSIPSYLPAARPEQAAVRAGRGARRSGPVGGCDRGRREDPGHVPTPTWWARAVDYLGNNLQRMLDGQTDPAREVIDQSTADIQTNLVDRQ